MAGRAADSEGDGGMTASERYYGSKQWALDIFQVKDEEIASLRKQVASLRAVIEAIGSAVVTWESVPPKPQAEVEP